MSTTPRLESNFSIPDGTNCWGEFGFHSQQDNLPFSEYEPPATSHPRHLRDTVRGAAHSMWSTHGPWQAARVEEASPRFSPSQSMPRHLGQKETTLFFFPFYWLLKFQYVTGMRSRTIDCHSFYLFMPSVTVEKDMEYLVLGWPKHSFGFFHNILRKNTKEILANPIFRYI